MRFIKILMCIFLTASLNAQSVNDADSTVDINFRDLEITDFVRLVSNVLNKNILLQETISGKVEFVSTKPVTKQEVLFILQSTLASKGFTMVDHGSYMEVVRSNMVAQYNLPVVGKSQGYAQMVTHAVRIKGLNVDEVISKVRHLASISAKFVSSKENNMIVITDFPKNIETIKKVITLMEQNVASEVAFIKMYNADIEQIFPVLQSIAKSVFNEKIEREKVSLYENKADNGVIAVGSLENIERLKDIIANMDKGQESFQMVTRVIQLNNTEAKNIHKILSEILSSNALTASPSGIIGGNKTMAFTQNPTAKAANINKPLLSLDEASNSIVVLAAQKDYEIIKGIISELDKEQKQVYVKAKIVEISETASQRIGVQYGLEGGRATSDGLYTFAMNMGGSALALSPVLSSAISIEDIKSGLALGASIDFLKTNGAANIISEPSLLCVNNIESKIYVGQTQSIITSATNSDSTTDLTRNTYTREDIGLTLKVKPRIANDGKVSLQIEATIEDVLDGSGGSGGMPTTTKREVVATAIVRHGESADIGGLMRNKATKNSNKVPLLGDIPIVGTFFTHSSDINDQVNIVLILTPYIVNSSSELSQLKAHLAEIDQVQDAFSKQLQEELQKRTGNTPSTPVASSDDIQFGSNEYWNNILHR
ncbi:MAG: type II secretion system secretin GspD [Campylobacteraceae bacterium]|jgi:general secretion pathway protein D|nr:type II secretion system secretin GspD [Campylobacteraceae bacterium]